MLVRLDSKENVFNIAGGICSLRLFRESGKLNVNLLRNEKNNSLNRDRIEQLLRLIDLLNRTNDNHSNISYSIVPSIIDWVDEDNKVTYLEFIKNENLGAESSYYEQLMSPYLCKNNPLDTMEELLFVKGITIEVFNQMRDYLTVYSEGKININYASKCVIESMSEKIDSTLAQMIINQRSLKLFDSVAELRRVPGITEEIYSAIKDMIVISDENECYYVQSSAKVGNLDSKIVAVLRRNNEIKKVELIL